MSTPLIAPPQRFNYENQLNPRLLDCDIPSVKSLYPEQSRTSPAPEAFSEASMPPSAVSGAVVSEMPHSPAKHCLYTGSGAWGY